MFKVECPGCKAPYQVDERRIPSSGLKMRCPKCGNSFKVDPPGDPRRTGPTPVIGGNVLGVGESVPPPPGATTDPQKGTMLGVAPARHAAMKGTMMGVAPAAAFMSAPGPAAGAPRAPAPASAAPGASAARPPVPGRPPVPRPAAASPAPGLDLPAVAGRPGPGAIDLPSVAGAGARPAPAQHGVDLPAVGRAPALDLPSPRGLTPPPAPAAPPPQTMPSTGIELDLPTMRAPEAGVTALPATAPQRGAIDLPSISQSQASLPAQRGGGLSPPARPEVPPRGAARGIELPSPHGVGIDLPSSAGRDLPQLADADLPVVGAGLPAPIELDLPSPGGDLPSLAADLPSSGGNLPALGGGLPLPAGSLPALAGSLPALGGSLPSTSRAGLPVAAGSLPAPASPSLPPALGGALSGGPSMSSPGIPAAGLGMRAPSFGPQGPASAPGEIELPPSESLPPAQPFGGGFGEVDLLGSLPPPAESHSLPNDSMEADLFGEVTLPGQMSGRASGPQGFVPSAPPQFGAVPSAPELTARAAPEGLHRKTGGGGTDYGEVSLDAGSGGGADVALDGAPAPAAPRAGDDDMEFGAVPQETAPGSSAPPVHVAPGVNKPGPAKPKSKLPLQILVGVFVIGLGGAALALVPSVGPFGAYFVMDRLNAGQYHALVQATAKSANQALALDTYPDAKRATEAVARAQAGARRAKGLAALAAYVGFTSELRFGTDAATHARASVLLDELAQETDVEMLALARSARAAADGQIAKARQLLAGAESQGRGVEAALLRAELELRAKDAKAALAAWEAAKKYGETPRVKYGLARAKYAGGDEKGALADAEAVLAKHPGHIGARILVARLSTGSRDDETRALGLLESVIRDAQNASPEERVNAHTLLGVLHLGRSRISAAESAFAEALKINPKAGRALVGLGDSLYRAGRYSEAQARFEAGTQADPDDLTAKIGVAKTKLALERVQEAAALLKKLRETQPKSPLVGYWFGRVQEALGARDAAQTAYKEVLKLAPADPSSADVYIALALLQNQLGRPDDAQKTLDSAKQLMPNVASVWCALGDVALSQGRYKEALTHFQRAATLDPDDLGAKFRIGSALRRDAQFDAAGKAFDVVAAIDKDYPGLALERGLLFEASGHSEEALKQYEDALAKAPTDPDLMLRVGCGKVAAGRAEQAEELLRKVLSQRPSSAETHHCLGRALLVQGRGLADALRMLERAVELDVNRAEYYLYVGWAANEAGNVPKAEKALAEALRLDQGLADAYWQRGVLRQRQGAVRDAISDLMRALQLRPSRFEAHAALAQALYDQGREGEAMKEWLLAIQAQPDNADWRFRYGKLLGANHQNDAAVEQLSKALSLIENKDTPPRWRWEAHHALARALGTSPEAVKHWEQFLRLGPRESPYRADAKAFLAKAGKPWIGD